MAWTASDITAIKTAMATGVRTVSVSGRTVTYASLAEMAELLRLMELEVNPQTNANRPNVRSLRYKEPL